MKILKKIKTYIRGIYYFSTELKTKIDVIPRSCYKQKKTKETDHPPPSFSRLFGFCSTRQDPYSRFDYMVLAV